MTLLGPAARVAVMVVGLCSAMCSTQRSGGEAAAIQAGAGPRSQGTRQGQATQRGHLGTWVMKA